MVVSITPRASAVDFADVVYNIPAADGMVEFAYIALEDTYNNLEDVDFSNWEDLPAAMAQHNLGFSAFNNDDFTNAAEVVRVSIDVIGSVLQFQSKPASSSILWTFDGEPHDLNQSLQGASLWWVYIGDGA